MLSAHGIINQNVSRVPGMQSMLGNTQLPETGAFDFLSYLLGLQVNSADNLQGQEAFSPGVGKESELVGPQDALQTIFQKKEHPLWNPMIPMGQASPLTQPMPQLKQGALDVSKERTDLSSLTTETKATQNNQWLETRLLEPNIFIEHRSEVRDGKLTEDSPNVHPMEMEFSQEIARSHTKVLGDADKNNEASIVKLQQVKHYERVGSSGTVNHTESVGEIEILKSSHSTNELKSSEKRRGMDQNGPWVIMESSVQSPNSSDGLRLNSIKTDSGGKVSLPEVFRKVESMIHHGGGKMTVELSPPELGKLEVDVVTSGNQVEIKMRSDNDFAKVALESHMGELKSAMEGQNLNLHKVEVQVGLGHGHDQFPESRQFSFSGNSQGESNRPFSQPSDKNTPTPYRSEPPLQVVRGGFVSKMRGGVDIRI